MGEAGIGKSRLLEELKHTIEAEDMPVMVLEGRCLSYGESISHFPVLEVLKNLFSVTDQDSTDAIRDKISSTVEKILPQTHQEVLPYLYYLFSVPLPAEYKGKVKHLDAEGLRLQVAIAIKEILESAADIKPILMVIDDYHWIDSASLDLLKFVFDTFGDNPILLLCLSRIEKESEGFKVKDHFKKRLGDSFTEIELSVLSQEASQQLTDNLLKFSGLTSAVQKEILSKAAGNPLYLEEIVRALIDRGLLVRKDDIWRSSENLTISDIPDSIQEIIVTRLDRLEPDLKSVLQKAAVIGRSFLVPLLERVTKIDSLMMSVHLATLEELEYIRIYKKEPELEYIFKHPLVQEVVYTSLPRKSRRDLHGRIAGVIEDVLANRIDEFSEFLAHHYSLSDEVDKTQEWLEKAGMHAKERYANDQAITFFEKLITAIDALSNIQQQHRWTQLKAYEALGDVCAMIGRYSKALDAYSTMVTTSDDRLVKGRAMRKTARVYWHQSDFIAALMFLDKALGVLTDDTTDVRVEQAEVHLLRGAVYEVQGSVEEAKAAINQALGIIADMKANERIKKIKANAILHLGSIYRNHGDFDSAIGMYEGSKILLEELNDKQMIANVIYLLGIVYHMKGDVQRAIDLNEESLKILEQIGDKKNIGRTCTNLGVMYSYLGEGEKTRIYQEKALRISRGIGDRRGEGMAYSNLAKCCLGDQEYDKARDYFQKNLDIAEEIGDKTNVSAALGNLAILHIRTGEYDKAESYLFRAEVIIKELGNKQLLATAYCYIADVKRLKNEPVDEVVQYIDKAWMIAQEIGSKASQADCAKNYAKVYASINEIKKAEEYMEIASTLFTELGRVLIMRDMYAQYAGILESVGETALADRYKKKKEALDTQIE
jgi:predicted ATPase